MTRSLVVLAGGRSTRFGATDKALADVAGRPMLAWSLDRLEPVVDDLVVNCRANQRRSLAAALGDRPVRFAVDPVPDRGPVAGTCAGLAVADDGPTLVVGCDMPFFDAATAGRLFRRAAEEADADVAPDAAVPVADGRRQPLGAVYRVESARAACERVGANGRLVDVLDRLDAREVRVPAAACRSLDTPGAVTGAEPELAGRAATR
ncbi:molybdenum cofactor guanylyltransferase [Halorarum salinum]|uniref:Molybdenum cofactor guanylyltransferase n=1 Tax=Halorarum salinum TaxID=2743089 RepID=A0A7D5QK41_9EURY|nr:molybdenum cofactor guanylyltransferase [Halobaculum salinum]QLG64184.1 molybdenum cofactor guanylyltransferase [Halobaculum salinum]